MTNVKMIEERAAVRRLLNITTAALDHCEEECGGLRALNAELVAALEGMLMEWDKLTRYGSPMAKAANERVNAARAATARAKGEA